MKYTLLTTNGSVRQFYVLALAETYQAIYGGVIISDVVVKQQMPKVLDNPAYLC